MENKMFGKLGEEFAENVLKAEGYEILARNFKRKGGEIDIVACKGNTVNFVEVKSRKTQSFGSPAEAVTREKKRHIKTAAYKFLSEYNALPDSRRFQFVSFSVIEVYFNHIRDAF